MRRFLCLAAVGIGFVITGCSDTLLGGIFRDTGSNEAIDVGESISEGLESWRKRGAILDGAACANCHAPDALDLAYFDFTEETIRRRSSVHTGIGSNSLRESDVNKIVRMVKALRIKYDITPKNHMKSRPFQPGGEVLPGATPRERDGAFGKYLVEQGYRFATIPVLSEEEALRQRDEWLDVNPRKVRIGIPLNRWSEDEEHGSDHSTMADWLPDSPRVPREGRADEWYGFQDAYLENPTDENFWKMYEQIKNLTRPEFEGNSERFFEEKYLSVLMGQHMFRKEVAGGQQLADLPNTVFMPSNGRDRDNPIWDVGAIAHVLRDGNFLGNEFELPADVIRQNSDLAEQMHQIRVPWFYTGWLFDQGLQHSGEGEVTETGRYFTLHMHLDDGYALHNIFAITRKLIVQNFDEETRIDDRPLVVNYENFDNYDYARKYSPEDPAARQIYFLITENSYRMMLMLMQNEIQENGLPADATIVDDWVEVIQDFQSFSSYAETEHEEFNQTLADQTLEMVSPM